MKAPLNTRPTTLNDAVHGARQYMLKAPQGVDPDDVLDPMFWTHVAGQLQEFDRIEVIANDKSWWGMFMVEWVSPRQAGLMQLALAHRANKKPTLVAEVKFAGVRRWRIVRTADNAVLEEDIPTREEAELRLAARQAA